MDEYKTITREALRLLLDECEADLVRAEENCSRCRNCQTSRHNDIRQAEAAAIVAGEQAREADRELDAADAKRVETYRKREAVRAALQAAEEE
jgi:hypothetical protein